MSNSEESEVKEATVTCPCHSTCPLQYSLKLIGGKWKIPLLCSLYTANGTRYSQLMKQIQGITHTMLASSLKELEREGLVKRVQYNEMPIRVEYFLTEQSKALVPILGALGQWGMEQLATKGTSYES